jgi:hypothetical protein
MLITITEAVIFSSALGERRLSAHPLLPELRGSKFSGKLGVERGL